MSIMESVQLRFSMRMHLSGIVLVQVERPLWVLWDFRCIYVDHGISGFLSVSLRSRNWRNASKRAPGELEQYLLCHQSIPLHQKWWQKFRTIVQHIWFALSSVVSVAIVHWHQLDQSLQQCGRNFELQGIEMTWMLSQRVAWVTNTIIERRILTTTIPM